LAQPAAGAGGGWARCLLGGQPWQPRREQQGAEVESERGAGKAREETRAARARGYGGAGARQWQDTRQWHAAMVARALCMAATPWTRAHYVEHVAGDERGMVGDVFGLDPG